MNSMEGGLTCFPLLFLPPAAFVRCVSGAFHSLSRLFALSPQKALLFLCQNVCGGSELRKRIVNAVVEELESLKFFSAM